MSQTMEKETQTEDDFEKFFESLPLVQDSFEHGLRPNVMYAQVSEEKKIQRTIEKNKWRMYPLTKEEIHFLKNMRDFGTTTPIILATRNGCRMPGFDTYAEALEVKKLAFQDDNQADDGVSQANPKSSISLSHLSLIRPKKRLQNSDQKYSSAASTQLQSIPKYEDAMIAKYVSGQFKKGKEAYITDFGGSKGFKHHRNNSMINLTHKGYKNHDFALANKNSEISNFHIPKLKSLEEDRNEATN